nr:DUF1064 domain-containing protein [Cereibacter sphaeroides f. sp. denitrificans]
MKPPVKRPRRNKFCAVPTTVNGITFDSKREARRYGELLLLERAGEIRDLQLQVAIMLEGPAGPLRTPSGRQMRLTVDFSYEDRREGWARVYEDSKGMRTRDYIVRKAAAEAMGYRIRES